MYAKPDLGGNCRQQRRAIALCVLASSLAFSVAACAPAAPGVSPSVNEPPSALPSASASAGSVDAQMLSLAQCLRDKGWTVEVGDGGIGANYPTDQGDRFQADQLECRRKAGMSTGPPRVSQAEAEWYYAEFLRVVPCVEAQGVQVAPPPSKAAFVEQLTTYPIPKWHPYDGAPEKSAALEKACPIRPWPGK